MDIILIHKDTEIILPDSDANYAVSIMNSNPDKKIDIVVINDRIKLTVTSTSVSTTVPTHVARSRDPPITLGCKHGDQCNNTNCKYICKNFANSTCKFGDNCKFHHWKTNNE